LSINVIYPKVLEKILVFLKKHKYVILFNTGKEAKSGSIVQFSTTNLAKDGKFAKNKMRFEIWSRKDGIKFVVKNPDDRILTKYSKPIMDSNEFKGFCQKISEFSSEAMLEKVSEQIYQQFELNFNEKKINDHILKIEGEI
jgi:hypothetical protein